MPQYDVAKHAAEGGKAKARNAPLSLSRVERELPALVDPESCKASLGLIRYWLAAGMLPHGVGGPLVALHREWLAAWNAQVDVERVKQLERDLAEAKAKVPRSGRSGLRVG